MDYIKQSIIFLPACLPAYLLFQYLKIRRNERHKYEKKEIEHIKHNCELMFNHNLGMSGWPDNSERLTATLHNHSKFNVPIIHFINTATKTLDVAVMNINHQLLVNPLIAALKRGVAVRIITDGDIMERSGLENLESAGCKVLRYGSDRFESIMHKKIILKDASVENLNGSVIFGSANWSNQAFVNNYENMIISTNKPFVAFIYADYEKTWNRLTMDCEEDFIYEI